MKLDKIWIVTRLNIFIYVLYNIIFIFKWRLFDELSNLKNIFAYFLGILAVYCFSEFINNIFKGKVLRSSIAIFYVCINFLLYIYHFRVKQSFSYDILIENYKESFSVNSIVVVLDIFKPKDLMQVLAVGLVLIILQLKFKVFNKKSLRRRPFAVILGAIYLFIITLVPCYLHDETSYFAKSSYDYYFNSINHLYEKSDALEFSSKEVHKSIFTKNRPNIFVVALESYSEYYVGKKENDKEVTPVLNRLLTEGSTVKNFYGNSVQTTKGHFSILCGRIPLARGKASYRVDGKKLECMPRLLKKFGYQTLFFQSYSDIKFDNTSNFMKDIGFDEISRPNFGMLSKKQRSENIWGWGLQDDISYIHYLNKFEKMNQNGRPVFSMIATISNHMKFKSIPKKQRYIYKEPSDKSQNFINSLHLSDKYLGEFIKELKKRNLYNSSIIIITGDHSYPNGQHGYYDSQTSSYEEFFKVPLVIIAPDIIKDNNYKITKKSSSQIDILPTVFDMIGESIELDLFGRSIFSSKESPTLLVQPYNGSSFGVIKWPFKYVWQKRLQQGYLFNLEKDPNEVRPFDDDNLMSKMKKEIKKVFYENELLLSL